MRERPRHQVEAVRPPAERRRLRRRLLLQEGRARRSRHYPRTPMRRDMKKTQRASTIPLKRTIGGRTLSAVIPARWDAEVEDYTASADAAHAGELAVAVGLARAGPIPGEAFSWMRRCIGLSARKLAEILDVRHETI